MSSSSSSFDSPEITPAMGPDIRPDFSYKNATHDEVLEDLSSRFILNLPDEELASLERISFQVEQAHWFYEDFIREQNHKLPSLPLKKFSAMLFNACPLLQHWSQDHEKAFNTFMQYKTRVPVCGAIMLNESWEKCLLVKGWKASSGWGFPKGKINEQEPQATCAVREVLEETGYNLAGQVNPSHVIEMIIKEQRIAMFIVPGVPEDYQFKTKTRKEISKIEWFRLSDLPTWKRGQASPGKFYLISPFIVPLKAWINSQRPRIPSRKSKPRVPPQFIASPIPEADEQCHESSQESSSQTSSADNGGPPTPSPQSTQATRAVHEDDAMTGIDPHFARLLSSLQISAAISTDPKVATDLNGPAPDTPTPETSPESQPAEAQPSIDLQPTIHTSPPSTVRSFTSQSTLTPSHSRNPAPTSSMPDSQTLSHTHTSPTPAAAEASVSAASPSATAAATSPRPATSRRTSSIADISPYLKKQVPTQTTPSHLKRLALLEGIANESARMTPRLEAQEKELLSTFTSPYPYPPPQQDPTLLYSSGRQSVAELARPLPMPQTYHDPFQVRPRTSLASHRPMGYNTGSMSSSQMMQMLHGHPAPPPPPPPQGAFGLARPPPYGMMGGPAGFMPGPYPPGPMHHPQPAPMGMPGMGMGMGMPLYGAPPPPPPQFPAMRTPNPQLLSILNPKGPQRQPTI